MAATGYVIVGRIKRAHGIRGEIVVEPLTDEPDAVFASGRRVFAGNTHGDVDDKAAELHVAAMRPFGKNVLLFVAELGDRNSAALFGGRYLLLPESEISQPQEGEVFVHELPGMQVVSESGKIYGAVLHTYDLAHGLMLEVKQLSGSTAMLPFRAELIVNVDRGGRVITVNVPDGLFED